MSSGISKLLNFLSRKSVDQFLDWFIIFLLFVIIFVDFLGKLPPHPIAVVFIGIMLINASIRYFIKRRG
jgi:hypothetical protein